MTWARVQTLQGGSTAVASAPVAAAFASDVVVNNRIFIFETHFGTLTAPIGPVKTAGTATISSFANILTTNFTVAGNGKLFVSIYTALVTGSGSLTITVTNTATSGDEVGWSAAEYSGLSTASGVLILDRSATGTSNNSTTSDASTGTTLATAAANQLALCMVGDWGTGITWTLSTANGFTKVAGASLDNDAAGGIGVAEKLSRSGATESAIWTNGAVVDVDVAMVAVIKVQPDAVANLAQPFFSPGHFHPLTALVGTPLWGGVASGGGGVVPVQITDSDSATLSESVPNMARTLNQGDAAALAERGAGMTRRGGITDAAALTDRTGMARSNYDTGTLAERPASMARTQRDYFTLAYEQETALNRNLHQGDTGSLSESGAGLVRRGGVTDGGVESERGASMARTAADAGVAAEGGAGMARTLNDLGTLTDTAVVTKSGAILKSDSDSFTFSERGASMARTQNNAESGALSERGAGLTRTANDTGTLAERGASLTRAGKDAGVLSEGGAGVARTLNDTGTEGERGASMARTVNDTATLSESATVQHSGSQQKTDSDSATLSERGASLNRTVRGESGVLGEGGASLARGVSDRGTLTDTATVVRTVFRSGSDTATLAERPANMARGCNDTGTAGERTKSMVRTLNDLFTLADAAAVAANFFGGKLGQSYASDVPALSYGVASDRPATTAAADDRASTTSVAGDRATAATAAGDGPTSTVVASDRA